MNHGAGPRIAAWDRMDVLGGPNGRDWLLYGEERQAFDSRAVTFDPFFSLDLTASMRVLPSWRWHVSPILRWRWRVSPILRRRPSRKTSLRPPTAGELVRLKHCSDTAATRAAASDASSRLSPRHGGRERERERNPLTPPSADNTTAPIPRPRRWGPRPEKTKGRGEKKVGLFRAALFVVWRGRRHLCHRPANVVSVRPALGGMSGEQSTNT